MKKIKLGLAAFAFSAAFFVGNPAEAGWCAFDEATYKCVDAQGPYCAIAAPDCEPPTVE